jgi:hypothetical protein
MFLDGLTPLTPHFFRPTTVTFPEPALTAFSSPDGSCLVTTSSIDGASILRAYHWSNFGSSDGILVQLGSLPMSAVALSSFAMRTNVHFVVLDVERHECRSVALEITRKNTEFSFQEKRGKWMSSEPGHLNGHNCLIDVHADVWTRFPVVPAIRRKTVHTEAGLRPRVLVLATNRDHNRFKPYWSNLIIKFEKNTRKPTEDELVGIRTWATSFDAFAVELTPELSSFLAGEWLVDLLCLIPIHLAVTRDNRFVPLRDGVFSANLERELLGATVGQIVDALSVGWYESIFSSYMSSKVS